VERSAAPPDPALTDPAPPALLIVAAALAGSPLPAALFPTVTPTVVPRETLRVATPWRGALFDLFEELAGGASAAAASPTPPPTRTVGLLVPVRWVSEAPAPELVIVTDHVNTRLRGPLTGRRPTSGPHSGGPQPFPSLTGLYQPETIRRAVGRRVYSIVAVAGVAVAAQLTPFERRAVAATGCAAVCDCLVDVAVIAALYGFKVAACGVPGN
jgi:hypothetical protein